MWSRKSSKMTYLSLKGGLDAIEKDKVINKTRFLLVPHPGYKPVFPVHARGGETLRGALTMLWYDTVGVGCFASLCSAQPTWCAGLFSVCAITGDPSK